MTPTEKYIQRKLDWINTKAGRPIKPIASTSPSIKWNKGNLHTYQHSGKIELLLIANEEGGTFNVTNLMTMAQMKRYLDGVIVGLELAENNKQ